MRLPGLQWNRAGEHSPETDSHGTSAWSQRAGCSPNFARLPRPYNPPSGAVCQPPILLQFAVPQEEAALVEKPSGLSGRGLAGPLALSGLDWRKAGRTKRAPWVWSARHWDKVG